MRSVYRLKAPVAGTFFLVELHSALTEPDTSAAHRLSWAIKLLRRALIWGPPWPAHLNGRAVQIIRDLRDGTRDPDELIDEGWAERMVQRLLRLVRDSMAAGGYHDAPLAA
jgi:hypothetical protein